MFLYNLKINGNRLIKFIFIVILIIILIIFSFGIYKIFFQKESSIEPEELTITDTISTDQIFQITPENYTTILQTVTNDIDAYIGCKIHFTGYVYRLIDFEENEFVLARDMIINENTSQSLVVGFLCSSKNASNFTDGSWVDVTGTITKGDYYGDIAQIQVTNIFECNQPENKYVMPPDNTYIPTCSIL